MDRVRTAYVVLTPTFAVGDASPLPRESFGDEKKGKAVCQRLGRLVQHAKFNEFVDKQRVR
jgi:hypothetical protein